MQNLEQVAGRSHYYVVYDGGWRIQCDGENSEPYQDKREAFRDAVDALSHRMHRGDIVFERRIPEPQLHRAEAAQHEVVLDRHGAEELALLGDEGEAHHDAVLERGVGEVL